MEVYGYKDNKCKQEINTFSTNEQRIGTWIDGKPLYRKVVIRRNFQEGSHSIGWENANIDTITKQDVVVVSTDGETLAGNIVEDTTKVTFKSYKINTQIDVWLTTSFPCSLCCATFEYTKTTD